MQSYLIRCSWVSVVCAVCAGGAAVRADGAAVWAGRAAVRAGGAAVWAGRAAVRAGGAAVRAGVCSVALRCCGADSALTRDTFATGRGSVSARFDAGGGSFTGIACGGLPARPALTAVVLGATEGAPTGAATGKAVLNAGGTGRGTGPGPTPPGPLLRAMGMVAIGAATALGLEVAGRGTAPIAMGWRPGCSDGRYSMRSIPAVFLMGGGGDNLQIGFCNSAAVQMHRGTPPCPTGRACNGHLGQLL